MVSDNEPLTDLNLKWGRNSSTNKSVPALEEVVFVSANQFLLATEFPQILYVLRRDLPAYVLDTN